MNPRKLTLEIIVNQDSDDWHWLFDTMKTEGQPINGVEVKSSCNGWLHDETQDALIWAHNSKLDQESQADHDAE